MDYSLEIRKTYLGAVPHTIFTALVWISSAVIAEQFSKNFAIAFFIISASFIFPGGELIRKLMKAKNVISPGNHLPQFFTLLAFTIPLSYPLIYLACKSNINYFFPAFTILIGAHYLPFIYGYRMITFGMLSSMLVAQGIAIALYFPKNFSLSGYLTGATLLFFALMHYHRIKKEI